MDEIIITCAHCGIIIDDGTEREHDGEHFCEDCFSESFSVCDECGETFPNCDVTEIDGRYYCDECRDENFTICYDCDEWIHNDDVVTIDMYNGGGRRPNNRYVCQRCADNNYYRCDVCDEYISSSHALQMTGDQTICNRCFNNGEYSQCNHCNTVFPWGDGYNDDEDDDGGEHYCCSECYNYAHPHGEIYSYNYKPDAIFYKASAETTPTGYYGVELEIDNGDLTRTGNISDITDALYLKRDGSLNNGVEIVTHPCTLDYHLNVFPWAEICETALNARFRSHKTDTCGLHVHASRTLFGKSEMLQDLTIAKIMLFFDRYFYDEILTFTRRGVDRLKQWAKNNGAGVKPTDDDETAVYKARCTRGDRYQAINLCNSRTVEFRIFRGTLKASTIKATIQWIDVLINYCKNHTLQECNEATFDDIFATTQYTELTNYLIDRKLNRNEDM